MAEKRSPPVPELAKDPSTSPPETKKSRLFEPTDSEESSGSKIEEPESAGDTGLETEERLSSTEPSSGSSNEEAVHEEIPQKLSADTTQKASSSSSQEPVAGTSRQDPPPPAASSTSILDVDIDIAQSTENLNRIIMGRRTAMSGDAEDNALVGEHAHYQEIALIGDGAYGTVYKARDLSDGKIVALKNVRVPLTEDGLPTSTLREIAGLKQLERFEHPHIVRLLDVCQGNYREIVGTEERVERRDRGLTLWLVFEHVERDLVSYITSNAPNKIPADIVKRMSKDILLGVDFLHSHRIIHRDLKPHNLLVTAEGRIKIADFGLAKTYDFEMRLTSLVVTLWYRAPEVLLGCTYATPVDLWSVGCILAEINRLEALFPGTSEGDQLDRIFQVIGTPSQENWPENVSLSWTAFPYRLPKPLNTVIPIEDEKGLDLIKNMLTFDPHIRLTAAQALRHEYFAGMES